MMIICGKIHWKPFTK